MNAALWLIPLLPLAGAAVNGLAGRRLSRRAVAAIGCGGPLLSFALSAAVWGHGGPLESPGLRWIPIDGADLVLRADALSILMMLVVAGVGSLIHLYSIGYMREDPGLARYFSYLNLFTFSMLVLVMGDNLLLMFVGWEGVGLCSYLLIGFWFSDPAKADAGKKAFIVNRVGDLGFLLGVFACFALYGNVNFETMRAAPVPPEALLVAPALLLFVGACGKSAQIPLYVWLPDAMAGPTPVSALIHAATMVTAGVYMLCRLEFLFGNAGPAAFWIALTASATALLAAVIAIGQNDIKKVLAYSTISQLGYMICGAAAGGGGVPAAMTHLTTHAFFKALLFLAAGAVIVACHHQQDIRRMGGLGAKIPLVCGVFLVGALSMGGPLAGMFSKESVMEAVHGRFPLPWLLLVVAAFLTPFYIGRLFVAVFLGKPYEHETHPVPRTMTAPLVVLAVASAVPLVWSSLVYPWLGHAWHAHVDPLHLGLSIAAMVLGYGAAWALRGVDLSTNALLANKFYVDEIYDALIVRPLKLAAVALWLVVDRFLIDYVLVHGPGRAVLALGGSLRRGHPGPVNIGVGAILLGALVALGYAVFFALHG
jgi:NADH-quinone oxidoreductase subunit L